MPSRGRGENSGEWVLGFVSGFLRAYVRERNAVVEPRAPPRAIAGVDAALQLLTEQLPVMRLAGP